jgi:uncharacterized membrane protein
MEWLFTLSGARNLLISVAVFLSIDMIWLLVISKNLYAKYLGYLMTDQVRVGAAAIFYFIFVVGLLFFVITPALSKDRWTYALFAGMFFGLITYATYDLTNLAVVKDWPVAITIIDLIWGTFLSSATATVSFLLIRLFQ